VCSSIIAGALARVDEAPQSLPTGTRKRLTRDTAGDDIHALDPPGREVVKKVSGVGQVAAVPQSAEIGNVGLYGESITVGARQYGESRVMKA
jgi:hypothetical protein